MKKSIVLLVFAALVFAGCNAPKAGEEAGSPTDKILLRDFNPTVVNNIPVTRVERAKFDIIDMHSHDYVENAEQIAQWCKNMDEVGVLNTAIMHCSWIGRPFEEVVELYIRDEGSPLAPPHPVLCGFQRVRLEAGEEKTLFVPIAENAFTVVNEEGKRIPGSGSWTLWAGFGQPDARTEELSGQRCLSVTIKEGD